MIVAGLIVGILTLIATIAIPIISHIKNRLRFTITMNKTSLVEKNGYYNFIVNFYVHNQSNYPVNIHKIELLTNNEPRYGITNYSPIKNMPIDENENLKLEVVFERLYKWDKPIKINVFTNKKNYSFAISEV